MKRPLIIATIVLIAGTLGALGAAGPATYQGIWGAGLHGIGAIMGCDAASPQDCALGTTYADPNGNIYGGDLCQNPNLPKSSAVINVGAAATAKIVDVAAGKAIYVCSWSGSLAGTTPTVQFKYGTHTSADCDTGAAAVSGTYAAASGSSMSAGAGQIVMQTPASQQLCATTAGSGSSFQGWLNYVQR